MYHVYWLVQNRWEKLHSEYDFIVTRNWALKHISYTGSSVQKVEIREYDEKEVAEVIYNNIGQ